MRQPNPVDPIEVEQAKLYDEIPDDATVTQAVAMMLDLDAGDNTEHLIVRQLIEADRHVERYAKRMRSVRRAAAGVGFNAGVSFAVAALRAREEDYRLAARAFAKLIRDEWPEEMSLSKIAEHQPFIERITEEEQAAVRRVERELAPDD